MAVFDYLFLRLQRGAAVRTGFAEALKAAGLGRAGQAAGLFTAQLGWEAAEVAVLAQRPDEAQAAPAPLVALPGTEAVLHADFHVLVPTVRPTPGAALAPGGIYVHRWFEVAAESFDDFVGLSAQAWPDFEARFDARIFGLFEVAAEAPAPTRRLLLLTRYASHGVWEDSRDPTTEAMQTFARRAQLTLSTRAASSLLTPL